MKILRRNDDFKKVPESSMDDVKRNNELINQGWKYCSRQEYKKFYEINSPVVEPVKSETKVKKSDNKKSKRKISKK